MPKLPSVSGKKIIRLQKGEATVTVPLHDPVKKTTLKSILNQAGVSIEELLEHL
ncbi:MAG: type II toxin-antitoxin system HicA family toxin [Candidatus Methanoperedens sp.]